ncbi:hypothetical protein C6A86_016675 [Mycobacterium sp. ITM-2016-00316]|uniref:hypothetical protein n=1 Tax=Mycobacterium sp. ITM-2016-00316 TaxID=2099695 RepID=UPI000CF9CC05|nr:hypothetical protein [Mycobacterium sp. ITM-2016-00316]WNG79905.1 hypothetical protein C6A86_016675 [Mycobacterium sp. ITM-2016-00316]
MRFVAGEGLWQTGPPVPPPPAVAVLEVAGAVLAWTVDDPAAPVQITFTDITAADWVWRVTGAAGHVALVDALHGTPADAGGTVDLPDLTLDPGALAPLRRLAIGHWLRRWWPASVGDAIVDLDAAVLDAEIAVLTASAQEFFTEDTLDSDIDSLLQPHRDILVAYRLDGDPRVAELAAACAELADWTPAVDDAVPTQRHRDDYALAAGWDDSATGPAIAGGARTIAWTTVPPAVFDAAEDNVDWSVHTDSTGAVVASVRTAVRGSAAGIEVRLRCADITAAGVLTADGTATLTLEISESAAWNQDWTATELVVGSPGVGEGRQLRDRMRELARSRLSGADDAFLAEVLAAESDY